MCMKFNASSGYNKFIMWKNGNNIRICRSKIVKSGELEIEAINTSSGKGQLQLSFKQKWGNEYLRKYFSGWTLIKKHDINIQR